MAENPLYSGGVLKLSAVATSGAYADLTGAPAGLELPIGFVFISTTDTDPATLLGYGTWTALGAGKVLVGYQSGSADFGTGGQTGGATGIAAVGSVSKPTFVGDAYTPSGTNAAVLFTPLGTNDVSLFVAAGTNAASVVTGSVSAEWPVGVPTFSGTAHQHGLPLHHSATAIYIARNTQFGTGTAITFVDKVTVIGATGTNLVAVSSSLNVALSQTATAAGIITWPATAPSAMLKNVTAAAQIFTGVTVSVSGQVFAGITGTVSGQTFTGVAKAATGTVSKPAFAGDITSVLQPYLVCYFFERTA